MAFGLFVLGRIVVGSVGIKMVRLLPSAAFVAQISSTAIIFPFAFIGIPLSGTHVLISAMIGTGTATKAKVDVRMTEVFSIAWILSFICPGILAAITVLILRLF
jgi:phosphate/sulfate permease